MWSSAIVFNFVILHVQFTRMTKYISILTFVLFTAGVTCGFSQSKLVFTGTYQGTYHRFDSLLIEDTNTGSKIVKFYPDTILKLLITGMDELPSEAAFSLGQNYPNPFRGTTHFNVCLPEEDKLTISIFNVAGTVILNYERNLPPGLHSFSFSGGEDKVYLLSAKTGKYSSAIKMLNTDGVGNPVPSLEYGGDLSYVKSSKKGNSGFDFNTGDNLIIKGYMTDKAGSVISDTITDSPAESTLYTFGFVKQNRIVILMYHKITDSIPLNEYERNSTDFENDLIYLRDHNYQILAMEDLLLLKSGDLKLASDGIIITFDDGYESNYTKAFPFLTSYNMSATFFLTTEWMNTADYITWPQVWEMSGFMSQEGKKSFRMASHTSSHPYLEKSAGNFATHADYLNFLNTELRDSKTWITDITGQTGIFLSLPFGDGANNQDIINTAVENGYLGIRTSIWNSFPVNKMNLFALPSIPVLSNTSINIIENYLNY